MKAFLEITEWADGSATNHVYWMNDSREKMYAFAPLGNKKAVKVFKNPIRIDTRGRKFKEVKNTFGFVETSVAKSTNPTWCVAGSKGATYTVELDAGVYTCTCQGFKFRGNCKHVTEIENGS